MISSKKTRITPINQLLKISTDFFIKNFKKLFLISITALPLLIIMQAATYFYIKGELTNANNFLLIILVIFIFLLFILFSALLLLQKISTIYYIEKKTKGNDIKIKEIFLYCKSYILQYLWIFILICMSLILSNYLIKSTIYLYIIFGAIFSSKYILTFLFSLSFLITLSLIAYLFYIISNFIFAFFCLIYEDIKGFNALKKSKDLIKGYWWNLFSRMAVLFLILIAVAYITNTLLTLIPLSLAIYSGAIIYFFITVSLFFPFTIIYFYFIYIDLKKIKKM